MYRWRKLSPEEQETLLLWRQRRDRPWHSPPHFVTGAGFYHVTAACYEHADIIGKSTQRLSDFADCLLDTLNASACQTHAWCVLPNHYHVLIGTDALTPLISNLGKLHGRTSFEWNGEDAQRGRHVWSAPADRQIRNDGHFCATLNYIHHNPVKHGWVERWQEWPFGSAAAYLEKVGRDEAARLWKQYPILDYGKGWDD